MRGFSFSHSVSIWLPNNYGIRNFTVERCPEVKIERGALKLAKRVVNLNFAKIQKLTVEENGLVPKTSNRRREFLTLSFHEIKDMYLAQRSIGGAQNKFKSIRITDSNFTNLASESFYSMLTLDSFSMTGNTFQAFPNSAFSKLRTENFEFVDNVVNGSMENFAFVMEIDQRGKFSKNVFAKIKGMAFSQITSLNINRKIILDFADNIIKKAAQNALFFNSSVTVRFQRIWVGSPCKCQLSQFDPNTWTGPNDINGHKLLKALVCVREDRELEFLQDYLRDECLDSDLRRGRAKEENICSLDYCRCKNRAIVCDCQNIQEISIGINSIKGSGGGYSIPPRAMSLTIMNSPQVKLSMSKLTELNDIRLNYIKSLYLGPDLQHYGKMKRKNITIENTIFYDSIDSNTFSGSSYENIILRNVSVDYIQRKAFSSIFNLSRIELDNVNIREEIGTETFYNISTDHFFVLNSRISEVSKFAFNVKVRTLFQLRNVTIEQLGEMALYSVSGNSDSKMDLTDLNIERFEEGSLMISNKFLTPGKFSFDDNKIKSECSCDMHKISYKRDRHLGLERNDVCRLIQCRHDGEWIEWGEFDVDHCGDLDDHDHVHYDHDGEILSLSKMAVIIASVLAGVSLVAVAVFTVACWSRCFPRKSLVGPILPIGEDEHSDHGAWQRVSFKRARSEPNDNNNVGMTHLNPYGAYYYNTDPINQAGLRRVSAIPAEIMRESGFVTEEAREFIPPPPYNDRTLDIIQDKRLGRQSLQAFWTTPLYAIQYLFIRISIKRFLENVSKNQNVFVTAKNFYLFFTQFE